MAARKPALHAVGKDEKPPARRRRAKPKPKTLTQAAATGTKRELLFAMRSRLAVTAEDVTTSARELAPLMKQIAALTNQIDALDGHRPAKQEDELDDGDGGSGDEDFDPEAI